MFNIFFHVYKFFVYFLECNKCAFILFMVAIQTYLLQNWCWGIWFCEINLIKISATFKDILNRFTSGVIFSTDISMSPPNVEILKTDHMLRGVCCLIGQHANLSSIWLEGQRWMKGYLTWPQTDVGVSNNRHLILITVVYCFQISVNAKSK